MINIVPISGPDGVVSVGNTSLLQNSVAVQVTDSNNQLELLNRIGKYLDLIVKDADGNETGRIHYNGTEPVNTEIVLQAGAQGAPGKDSTVPGPEGPAGKSFNIVGGIYREPGSSKNLPDLPSISSTPENNAYVVDDDAIAGQYDLYYKGIGGTSWTKIDNWGGVPGQKGNDGYTPVKGVDYFDGTPGGQGNPGAAATITIGTVTTGSAGSSASVTNSGSSQNAVLNFTIPQGAQGADGSSGGVLYPYPTTTYTAVNLEFDTQILNEYLWQIRELGAAASSTLKFLFTGNILPDKRTYTIIVRNLSGKNITIDISSQSPYTFHWTTSSNIPISNGKSIEFSVMRSDYNFWWLYSKEYV